MGVWDDLLFYRTATDGMDQPVLVAYGAVITAAVAYDHAEAAAGVPAGSLLNLGQYAQDLDLADWGTHRVSMTWLLTDHGPFDRLEWSKDDESDDVLASAVREILDRYQWKALILELQAKRIFDWDKFIWELVKSPGVPAMTDEGLRALADKLLNALAELVGHLSGSAETYGRWRQEVVEMLHGQGVPATFWEHAAELPLETVARQPMWTLPGTAVPTPETSLGPAPDLPLPPTPGAAGVPVAPTTPVSSGHAYTPTGFVDAGDTPDSFHVGSSGTSGPGTTGAGASGTSGGGTGTSPPRPVTTPPGPVGTGEPARTFDPDLPDTAARRSHDDDPWTLATGTLLAEVQRLADDLRRLDSLVGGDAGTVELRQVRGRILRRARDVINSRPDDVPRALIALADRVSDDLAPALRLVVPDLAGAALQEQMADGLSPATARRALVSLDLVKELDKAGARLVEDIRTFLEQLPRTAVPKDLTQIQCRERVDPEWFDRVTQVLLEGRVRDGTLSRSDLEQAQRSEHVERRLQAKTLAALCARVVDSIERDADRTDLDGLFAAVETKGLRATVKTSERVHAAGGLTFDQFLMDLTGELDIVFQSVWDHVRAVREVIAGDGSIARALPSGNWLLICVPQLVQLGSALHVALRPTSAEGDGGSAIDAAFRPTAPHWDGDFYRQGIEGALNELGRAIADYWERLAELATAHSRQVAESLGNRGTTSFCLMTARGTHKVMVLGAPGSGGARLDDVRAASQHVGDIFKRSGSLRRRVGRFVRGQEKFADRGAFHIETAADLSAAEKAFVRAQFAWSAKHDAISFGTDRAARPQWAQGL